MIYTFLTYLSWVWGIIFFAYLILSIKDKSRKEFILFLILALSLCICWIIVHPTQPLKY